MIAKFAGLGPLAVLGLTLVWYAALVIQYPTRGAIGNDPATYVGMALDLAERGTVTHSFALFNNLSDTGLSWDAFITPGYHTVRETGAIAPNFAFGLPLLLAFGYRLLGESALYRATPLMGLLALLVTFALALEFWRDLGRARRYWVGALAALLLATSPRQIQLALVPMSDVPTQLFCALAIWCALRAFRPSDTTVRWNTIVFAALCGLALGIAYLIRHSALVLFIPISVTALWSIREKGLPVRQIGIALLTFAVTILPDVIYRATTLGSPLAVESPESAQLALSDAPRQIIQTLAALFSVTGPGPVLLVLVIVLVLWRENQERFAIVVLTAWVLAFILFHAPLRLTGVFENSLRYVLPAYPAIALLIGRAMVALFDRGWSALREWRTDGLGRNQPIQRGLAVLGALLAALLFLLAIRAVAGPERFVLRSYGWMSAAARSDLDALSQTLPQNAVIGVSDQMAGAVMLYVKRDIFRPAAFRKPEDEFPLFLIKLRAEDRAVYLLGDWKCSPLANASESLPEWLAEYPMSDTGLEIEDLPYECEQRIYEIK
ncbi:MAG: phospholipid carrier-dependent glycosyltransferase [Anaerolineae bacterium]|nr:phospholipid carrier-dependent glycosyltransferase [Anaerolineae bacterium]